MRSRTDAKCWTTFLAEEEVLQEGLLRLDVNSGERDGNLGQLS